MTMSGTRRDLLDNVVSRATKLIDEETELLKQHGAQDHGAIVVRKNLIAFELECIAQLAEQSEPDRDLRRQFALLRTKLEQNRSLLEVHVSASREIARILAEIVEAPESDGTYTVRKGSYRRSS